MKCKVVCMSISMVVDGWFLLLFSNVEKTDLDKFSFYSKDASNYTVGKEYTMVVE